MHRLTCECPGSPLGTDYEKCPEPVTQEDGLCDYCRVRRCPEVTTIEEHEEADRRWFVHVQEEMRRTL